MKRFILRQPADLGEALGILHEQGLNARPLAGGTDIVVGVMRDQLAGKGMPYPGELVDLTTVPSLAGVRVDDGGCAIGATTTLVDIVEHADLARFWPMLVEAAAAVATPEIRSIATLGGNIHQRPRCWFFRNKDFDCIKKGGEVCYAVKGDNRYNAIVGGHLCYIVHPSDLAVALLALGADARVASKDAERVVAFDGYFVSPRENLQAETVLRPDEILTEVRVPYAPPGTFHAFEKFNDKGLPTWDFAQVSVAVAAHVVDGVWQAGRIVLGGVAPVPYRATVVEEALDGKDVDGALVEACAAFRTVTRPMSHNDYKVDLAVVVLERAIRKALERPSTPTGEP